MSDTNGRVSYPGAVPSAALAALVVAQGELGTAQQYPRAIHLLLREAALS